MTAIREEMKGERNQDAIIFMGARHNSDSEIARLAVAGTHQRPATSNHMQISHGAPFPVALGALDAAFDRNTLLALVSVFGLNLWLGLGAE